MKKFDYKILSNPRIFEQNTVQPHTAMRTDKPYCFEGENPTAVLLNGKWKFKYSEKQNDFEGFEVDPDVKTNWQSNQTINRVTEDDYYYSLAKYKGLSADSVRTLDQDASILGSIINWIIDQIPGIDLNSLAREVKNTPKSDTLIEVKA